jgi:mannose-1-phosphate guanylyltransferase
MSDKWWVIVLAGGEGSRIRHLTRDEAGEPVPKQFARLGGERTLLAATLERARDLVPRERIAVSVIEAHRKWWAQGLADHLPGMVVSQPLARGTAAGVLLPLLRILDREPGASVMILPADHAVDDEPILRESLRRAARVAECRSDDVVLLGITPTSADPEFGWIVPAGDRDLHSDGVGAFVEKPDARTARRLMAAGAMWNAFLVATTGPALIDLYRRHLPGLLAGATALRRGANGMVPSRGQAAGLELPIRDFSRDLLTPAVPRLRVVRVPSCGWTDLGTPARLRGWIATGHHGDRIHHVRSA